jgi:hypothetical protein
MKNGNCNGDGDDDGDGDGELDKKPLLGACQST